MIKSKLWIVLTVSLLLSNTVWAKFCSECGKPLPSDTAKFCSECGASINGNSGSLATNKSDSIQDKLDCGEGITKFLNPTEEEIKEREDCL